MEDSPADAELMAFELRSLGMEIESSRVEAETAFSAALKDFFPDIILSDYSLPSFDGTSALAMANRMAPGVPFIFVTGTLGEERAVELLKSGATDFVLKDRLPRLSLCVSRALEEVAEKRRREQAEQDLRRAHAELEIKVAKRTRELSRSMDALRASEGRFRTQSEHLLASEEALKKTNEELEVRVRERTAELAKTVHTLQAEILQRRKVEIELRQSNEQLNRRAAQLRILTGELTMAEQRERKRLSRILHDGLQQHLAATKLQIGLVKKKLADQNNVQSLEKIEQMLVESIQMSRSLSMDLSPPSLSDGGLSSGLIWLASRMREQYGFQVELIEDKISRLPEDTKILLFESLRELLFNAVKHAGVSAASVQVEKVNDTAIRICVRDDGVGFDPSHVNSTSEGMGGLGLFSIRERIGLIGGDIEIDSAPGRGSRFTLTIPTGRACTEISSNPSVVVRDEAGKPPLLPGMLQAASLQVLVVDDHALFRDGIAQMLAHEGGIDVVGVAGDGTEAIALAMQLKPDVILMDVSMPGVNGMEATRVIHRAHPDIRIIGLSFYADEQIAAAMKSAGAEDFKSKGCPASELVSAIRDSRN